MADVVKDRIFTYDQGDTINNKLDAITEANDKQTVLSTAWE